MYVRTDDKITTSQTIVLVSSYMLGSGILTLPRTLSEKVKTPDGWISLILGAILICLAGISIVKLCQRFPGQTIFQFGKELIGSWLSIGLSLVMIMHYVTIAAFEIRVMSEVTELYLLEGTPSWAIVMSFMWIGLYLTMGGVNPMTRLFEIILPLSIVVFLLCMALSFKIFDISNIRPVLGEGVIPVIRGLKSTILVFSGYEILFIFTAFMQYPKKGVKALIVGTTIPLILYLATLIMVVGALSIDGVERSTWPTLDLIRSFEITGLLFERFEFFLLVIWIMQIFSTFSIAHYIASLGLAQISNKSIKPILYALIPITYIVAMLPKNINELFDLGSFIGDVSIIIFGIIPVLLLIIAKLFKKGVVN